MRAPAVVGNGAGDWHGENQRRLAAALDRLRARLLERAGEVDDATRGSTRTADPDPGTDLPAAPLEFLVDTFRLSPFEREVLLLCAGVELDAGFRELVRRVGGDTAPTFGFALALADGEGEWNALHPGAPLRRWHLVEVGPAEGITRAPLRLPERVLHHLLGLRAPEAELVGRIQRIQPEPGELVPTHTVVAREVARLLGDASAPVVQLVGADRRSSEAVVARAASDRGLEPVRLPASLLPRDPAELERLARLWEREAALDGLLLLLEAESEPHADPQGRPPQERFLELLEGPVVMTTSRRLELRDRVTVELEVPRPTPPEQADLWREALGSGAAGLNGAVERVVAHFALDPRGIRQVARSMESSRDGEGVSTEARLWAACRREARTALEGLAHRIEPRARWNDLVLPELQLQTLRMLAAHVRNRATVLHGWGFEDHASRGHGVSALFAGPSGTGKTLAAEVVAGELGLDLHLIDLSQVVNKYIGETEKNLARVFDAAERGGAVLLFDEADALFGKRSEVKDSHDRYANIEVSYLLQRMESYRGLAILTTNQKGALDDAFLRRIRFVVSFPFPGPAQRAEIWRRAFPADTPTRGLDPEKLSRLNVSGGHIRNIALNAAFLAADAGGPVGMEQLLAAARLEYAKLEKPFTDADPGGWK